MSGRRVSAQIGLEGRHRLPRRRTLGWMSGAVAALMGLTATSAEAECVPSAATVQAGETVICTGTDNSPYVVPAGIDQVTIEIQDGASFPFGAGGVQVNDESQVTNSGEILIDFLPGGIGIAGGNGGTEAPSLYENTASGTITVASPDSWGIATGSGSDVRTQGQISVSGDNSIGVQVGNFSRVQLEEGAQLDVTGPSGTGVLCEGNGCEFSNTEGSNLVVAGEDSLGFVGGASSQFVNDGLVEISGAGATGFRLEGAGGGSFANGETGILVLSEPGTVGALGEGDGSTLSNDGRVEITGPYATGFHLTGANGSFTNSETGVLVLSEEGAAGAWGEGEASTLSNEGSISSTETLSRGLEAGFRGQVSNAGAIEMSGDGSTALRAGDGRLDLVEGNRSQATVEETGTVTLSGQNSVALEVGQYGYALNRGEITVTGDGSVGMRAGVNSAVQNFGLVRISGENSEGLRSGGYGEDPPAQVAIGNYDGGVIESTDPRAGALLTLAEGTQLNLIQNLLTTGDETPRITANLDLADAAAGLGIAIQGSSTEDGVTNGGLITGFILLGEGDDFYETTTSGQLTDLWETAGDAALDGGPGEDTVDLLEEVGQVDPASFDLSLIKNFEEVRIQSGIWQVLRTRSPAPGSPETDLEVAPGAVLYLSEPTHITGSYRHEAPPEPGDQQARVEVLLSPGLEDQVLLQVDGTADLENGELEIGLTNTVRQGGTYTILFSNEELTTEFDSVVLPSSNITRSRSLTYGSNSLVFSFETLPFSPNQTTTSNYFDSVPTPGQEPDVTNLLTALDSLSLDQYLEALNQLMPEAYDAQAVATLELANTYTDLMLARPNYCVAQPDEDSRHPTTGLPCQRRPFEPWMSVYGQKNKRTGRDEHISYHDEGGGLVVGLDHRVDHRLLLTGTLGTAYDVIHVDNVGKGRLTTVDIGFGASWADGPLRIQGVASYGYGWNQRYRRVAFGDFAGETKAEYGMSRIGLRGRAEYAFRFGHLQMAPLVSLDYTALIRPVITETGGGAANLYIDETTNNITTVRVGVDLSSALHKRGYWTELLENADGVWRPRLSVAWRQVVTGQHRDITSRLDQVRGSFFTIQADAADRGFEIGGGIDWSPARIDRFSFGVHYDAFVWEDVLDQSVVARARFSF